MAGTRSRSTRARRKRGTEQAGGSGTTAVRPQADRGGRWHSLANDERTMRCREPDTSVGQDHVPTQGIPSRARAKSGGTVHGIDASLGGCAPDRPAFTASTCTEVGLEYGTQLNGRLLQIYRGPEVMTEESRAVRASHVMTLTTSLANLHLRRIGIVAACGVDEFLAGAEKDFSHRDQGGI